MSIRIQCPDYVLTDSLDFDKVSKCIDGAMIEHFDGKQIVLRALQSAHHKMKKDKLINEIKKRGTDRFYETHTVASNAPKQVIDTYGRLCKIGPGIAISLPILEGFHKWAPKALERPQYPVDIWMIYDAVQLTNVAYKHPRYKVTTKDGWTFKDPENKAVALLGIIEIV